MISFKIYFLFMFTLFSFSLMAYYLGKEIGRNEATKKNNI